MARRGSQWGNSWKWQDVPGWAHYWEELKMQEKWEDSGKPRVFMFPDQFPASSAHWPHPGRATLHFTCGWMFLPSRPLPVQVHSAGPGHTSGMETPTSQCPVEVQHAIITCPGKAEWVEMGKFLTCEFPLGPLGVSLGCLYGSSQPHFPGPSLTPSLEPGQYLAC